MTWTGKKAFGIDLHAVIAPGVRHTGGLTMRFAFSYRVGTGMPVPYLGAPEPQLSVL
jgi:hypothetical protein